MTSCTFAEFFAACKDKMTDQQLRMLASEDQYFKLENGYCGLNIEPHRVWVSILVGGIRDIWHLRKTVMLAGIPLIGFTCRPGSKTQKMAEYYGATIEALESNRYPDGIPSLLCLIHTQQTQRLLKSKEKSQALN